MTKHNSPTTKPVTEAWDAACARLGSSWHALTHDKPPAQLLEVDDSLSADLAFQLASNGVALLWRGDFQNAKQMLQALQRRLDKSREKRKLKAGTELPPVQQFHQYRMQQAQRARLLGMLVLPFDPGFTLPLRRAPQVDAACRHAYAAELASRSFIAPLRELLGIIGAEEWRKNGVEVARLEAKIHPHYGVFSPLRGEYLELVWQAPLPRNCRRAFDIGTGSGVLAALLAKRGVGEVVATDNAARALACARENLARLAPQVEVLEADLFPPGRADLLLCNPPWLPGKAASLLEQAIYDGESRMLRAFLRGAAAHLEAQGQAWLILSDLAEHLQLRSREQLLTWIKEAGLVVVARDDIVPQHKRSQDREDPLHFARSRETTSLWRLKPSQ